MLGAALAERLIANGGEVTIASRAACAGARLEHLSGQFRFAMIDWTRDGLTAELRRSAPDVIFHFASAPFNPPGIPLATYVAANVETTAVLVDAAALAAPSAAVVYTSSAAVYGNAAQAAESSDLMPSTWLGATKAMAGMLLAAAARMHGFPAVELRLFTPYGPRERAGRLIPSVVLRALAGEPIPLGSGEQERDFVYIDDVVDALLAAAELRPAAPLTFNVGSGHGIRIREIVERLLTLLGRPDLARFGSLSTRGDELLTMSADITRASDSLGWKPRVSLDEGLARTVAWYRSNCVAAARMDA